MAKVLATADFTNNEFTILREGHVNRYHAAILA